MGQALYRNYRPKTFAEVVGQDHITTTLQNAIKSGRISHAYLFTGPRGVGKTSVARILAHEVNAIDYKDEAIDLDIIEIDAASNRRIDEIRDLRDKVRVAPTKSKYKVYIIDEVHMLTREAFNALLKTLEEPPAHCIFILATTEAHKLPETIISRTQRFEFRPLSPKQAAEHLGSIAKEEKITIDAEALALLAEFGRGSFRDSIGYLDQLSSFGKKITEADVRNVLGLPPKQEIEALLSILAGGETAEVLSKLSDLERKGVSPAAVAAALAAKLREQALSSDISDWQIKLLSELLKVSASVQPQEALEIILLGAAAQNRPSRAAAKSLEPVKDTPAKQLKVETDTVVSKPGNFNLDMWDEVVERSKDQAASIYTALRLAKPEYADGKLILGFQFPLHQKKLNQAKNKDMLARIIHDICGQRVALECVTANSRQEVPAAVKPAEETVSISAISNIFGNAEVLEA